MDFVTYKMHAKFGNIAGENDTAFRFNEIDVNFNAFTQPENTFANFGYGFSALGALVSVFAMLSWTRQISKGQESAHAEFDKNANNTETKSDKQVKHFVLIQSVKFK